MSQWTDKHYNFTYKLTQKDVEAGEIKVDPYFVGMVWKTGSRDDSGALAHCLKTIARFGDKNPIEREIKALYAQVKGLARVHGVELKDVEDSFDNPQPLSREGQLKLAETLKEASITQGNSTKPAHCGHCVDGVLPWPYAANREGSPCHMCLKGEEIRTGSKSPLWYPDDSGAWIECNGSGQPVGDDVEVMVLLRYERITKEYEPLQDYAGNWCWTWGGGWQ